MRKNQFIEKPKSGKRFVIGDIHGCYKTLKKLVNKLNLKNNDQLFFIGDYIDRGPDSKGVLDYIIDIHIQNLNVYPLIGNHEATLIELNNDEFRFLEFHLKQNNSLNLLDGEKLIKKYIDFINSLPYYYELNDFYIVHAGFDLNKVDPFNDYTSMLWIRNMPYISNKVNNKTIIIGHQPTNRDVIETAINNKEKVIPLDNGIAYRKKHKIYDYNKMGCLTAFNLDSFEIVFEENIDIPKSDS